MTYVIVRQNHSISDVLLKLAERTERTPRTLRGHVAVVVPMFSALIVITSVDRLGTWRDRDPNDIFAHCALIFYIIREVLQTEPVRFSERSASGF